MMRMELVVGLAVPMSVSSSCDDDDTRHNTTSHDKWLDNMIRNRNVDVPVDIATMMMVP